MILRIKWIETLRVIAATIVFTSHFLHEFDRSLFDYVWQLGQNTTSSPMVGITGKFCVALFGVISGYLAARSASSQKTSKYILNRYVGFLIPILITNIIAIGVFYLKGYDIPPI